MAKPLRKKKCRWCKEWFQPHNSLHVTCKPVPCAVEYARQKERDKAEKAHRERKKELKPMSHWLAETQKVFNEYIRLRDYREPCISCDTLDSPQWCAGHYRSRGAASQLRFNEDNVHKQCNKKCNLELSGNIGEYRPRLVAKIGEERVLALENDNSTKSWTREELEEMRAYYRAKIKEFGGAGMKQERAEGVTGRIEFIGFA